MDLTILIAVPSAMTAVLMQVFQALKSYVLEPYVPGFSPTDPNSNRNLRLAFFALTALSLLGWVLSGQAGVPLPTDVYGWAQFAYVLLNSAGVLTGVAHLSYTHLTRDSGSSQPAQPSDPNPGDFPPGAPSLAALGLPSEADSADVSEQDTAVSLPAAA